MKEGWTYKKLGEVFPIVMGKTPPRNIARFWDKKKETGNRWVSIADLSKNEGKEIYDTKEYISDEGKQNIKLVPKGSLLVSFKLTLGKMAFAGVDLYTNEAIMSLEKRKDIDLMFLFYYFSYLNWNKIASGNEKVKGKTLNKKSLSEIPVVYIPLSEQRSIVTRLDTALSRIDALKANAEKQLNEAKALFQKALAEEMKPKERWEEKTLGEITVSMADGPFGSNLKKEHYTTNKEVRIIQLSNIGEEGWREDNTKYTTFEHLKTIQRSEVKPGDVVIAKMMPAGRAILCPDNESKYVLSSDAVRATLKEGLDKRFVCFAINSSSFRRQVYANVSGSGRVRTSLTKLRDCKLYIPSPSDQQAIVAHLDSISSNIRKLEELQQKTIAECDALKQAMLREVFE